MAARRGRPNVRGLAGWSDGARHTSLGPAGVERRAVSNRHDRPPQCRPSQGGEERRHRRLRRGQGWPGPSSPNWSVRPQRQACQPAPTCTSSRGPATAPGRWSSAEGAPPTRSAAARTVRRRPTPGQAGVVADRRDASAGRLPRTAGGRRRSEVPGQGWYGIFRDPEGNELAVWESLRRKLTNRRRSGRLAGTSPGQSLRPLDLIMRYLSRRYVPGSTRRLDIGQGSTDRRVYARDQIQHQPGGGDPSLVVSSGTTWLPQSVKMMRLRQSSGLSGRAVSTGR